MSHCFSAIVCPPFVGNFSRRNPKHKIQRTTTLTRYARSAKACVVTASCVQVRRTVIRRPPTSIHVLDDDSLLNIFNSSRPSVLEEDENGYLQLGDWGGERWWYKFVQVCQRWRYLILGSASHLNLSLLCTRGTPVHR